jgi:hypothetical protein
MPKSTLHYQVKEAAVWLVAAGFAQAWRTAGPRSVAITFPPRETPNELNDGEANALRVVEDQLAATGLRLADCRAFKDGRVVMVYRDPDEHLFV